MNEAEQEDEYDQSGDAVGLAVIENDKAVFNLKWPETL